MHEIKQGRGLHFLTLNKVIMKLIINVAPKMILVNGIIVAKTFTQFAKYIVKYDVDITAFSNWPFVFGLSTDLETKKVNFYF